MRRPIVWPFFHQQGAHISTFHHYQTHSSHLSVLLSPFPTFPTVSCNLQCESSFLFVPEHISSSHPYRYLPSPMRYGFTIGDEESNKGNITSTLRRIPS